MAKVVIAHKEHFVTVARQAKEKGLYGKLSEALHQLQEWGRGREDKETQVRIGYDFADLSFGFALVNPGQEEPCIIGGLIFHPGGNSVDTSCSVELVPQAEPHWSVHT